MTREEFVWKIEHGDDIMLDVAGKHFVILTWTMEEEGICISEQNVRESNQYFQSAEELVDNYSIEGFTLASLVDQIKITDYTLATY